MESTTSNTREHVVAALSDRYAIEGEVGRGGMAIVFRGEDLKHHRKVAVKVMHHEVSALLGRDRFLREIEVIAHLQHSHIVPLFDSGDVEGLLYYVMPFIEGASLQQRLRRERQIAVDDAVRLTVEVADALDYAHRRGLIHRDIKPANILLQEGHALVADFGIALAVTKAAGDRLTSTGLSIGTPEYMSPEQAMGGHDVDARSDQYALAAVLYEMLAGEPPFTGLSPQAALAKALVDRPRPIRDIRDTTPLPVAAAIERALAKVPADRFPTAGDFARALTGPRSGETVYVAGTRRRWRFENWRTVAAGAGWLMAVAIGALAWWQSARHETAPSGSRQTTILLPDSAPVAFAGDAPLGVGYRSIAISRDGQNIAYVAQHRSSTVLYLRALDRLATALVPGSDGAYYPFFSPDGRWVAFFAGAELRKAMVSGGRAVTVAQVNEPYAAFWANDGNIVMCEEQGGRLSIVPEGGGTPRPHANISCGPMLAGLPDGEWILTSDSFRTLRLVSRRTGRVEVITDAGVVPNDSADVNRLLHGSDPRYVASGHIVYMSSHVDGVMMALPFDARRRRVLGPPAPVLEGVRRESLGSGQFSVADDGTLLYAPGRNAGSSVFVWLTPGVKLDTLPLPSAGYGPFEISPDGRRLFVRIESPAGRGELRVVDFIRGISISAGSGGLPGFFIHWSADGARLIYPRVFQFNRPARIVRQTLSGDLTDTIAIGRSLRVTPSRDGKQLAVADDSLYLASATAPQNRRFVAESGFFPQFSPDGMWLAFTNRAAGQSEVFLARVDSPRQHWKVSTSGGEESRWGPRGDRLIYRNRNKWYSVSLSLGRTVEIGRPSLLFEGPYLNVPGWSHDLAPDGRRHLLLVGPPEEAVSHLVVVTNWFEELARRAPRRQ